MAKTRITVEVAPGLNQWSWSDPDEAFTLVAGGQHQIPAEQITADLLAALGAAVAAGSLILVASDAESRKAIEQAVEPDKDSLKKLESADRVRAELLVDRDQALDGLSAERAQGLVGIGDDEAAAKDEAARYLAAQDQILAGHDDRVDAELRKRLGGEEG